MNGCSCGGVGTHSEIRYRVQFVISLVHLELVPKVKLDSRLLLLIQLIQQAFVCRDEALPSGLVHCLHNSRS